MGEKSVPDDYYNNLNLIISRREVFGRQDALDNREATTAKIKSAKGNKIKNHRSDLRIRSPLLTRLNVLFNLGRSVDPPCRVSLSCKKRISLVRDDLEVGVGAALS